MQNEDNCLFFGSVDEQCVQLVHVRCLVNKIVKFIAGGSVLDVVNNGVEDRSQFLVKS